jgi:hypothetical protein
MKKFLSFAFIAVVLLIVACDNADTIFNTISKEKFAPPLGLTSVTQDGQVTLFWFTSNYEDDFGGYFIFKATGDYTYLTSDSTINENYFTKADSVVLSGPSDAVRSAVITGLTNGTTYSFTVVAFNKKDKEKVSYPSNVVKDTPRPQITTVTVKSASTSDVAGNDAQAGFDFNNFQVVAVPASLGNYTTADQVVDMVNEAFDPGGTDNIRPWIAGMNGAGLQDLGYMEDLDDADVAPAQGYSDSGESLLVLIGHVYAIRTGDDHYGKLVITDIGDAGNDFQITFNAAMQLVSGDSNYKTSSVLYQLGIH